MRPLGGGDPIPLKKDELILGRRPTCDIRLDFDNISGKHCTLKYIRGTWHVRDLGSTNGTTVNGQRISSEHGLMPDDELGIAGHFYMLDYSPEAPTSLLDANQILEEEMAESPRNRSLLELAGLENPDAPTRRNPRPQRPPETMARPKADEEVLQDEIPDHVVAPKPIAATDDDFFDLIKGDVDDGGTKPKRRR